MSEPAAKPLDHRLALVKLETVVCETSRCLRVLVKEANRVGSD
jgi:hypothetical protein